MKRKNKIIELKDALNLFKYNVDIYSLFLPFLQENIFVFFKNYDFVIFNAFADNKIMKIQDDSFLKIFEQKSLSAEEFSLLKDKLHKAYEDNIQNLSKKDSYIDMPAPTFGVHELRLNFSNYCTLNCKYCFQKEKNSHKLTLEQCYSQIDNFIKNASIDGSILLTVAMTSEPFLDLAFIKKIYNYLQEKCLNRLKTTTSKKDLFTFLHIDSDKQYHEILGNRDYYKDCFKDIDKRFISDTLEEKLKVLQYTTDNATIRSINEDVVYTSYSAFKNSYYLFLNTNGTITPSEEDVVFLKKLFSKAALGVSFDGNYFNSKDRCYKDGKSSYKVVLNNIRFFQQRGIKFRVTCTITENNNNFIQLIKFFNKKHITDFSFSFKKGITCTDKLLNNIKKLFKYYEKGKINSLYGLDKYSHLITSHYKCLSNCAACSKKCIGYDNQEYFCDYFINSKTSFPKNNLSVLSRTPCNKCPFSVICGGTCRAVNKDDSILEGSCRINQEIIKQLIYLK